MLTQEVAGLDIFFFLPKTKKPKPRQKTNQTEKLSRVESRRTDYSLILAMSVIL